MPLLLELFSGTGSVGKGFAALGGWEVVSVDIDSKSRPTIVADVLRLDPRCLPTPDFVWASPPCTHYSRARTTAKTPRDLIGSDALVQKTLDIVEHFGGVPFIMENPFTGLLKSRPVIQGIPMSVVDYCMYGAPYRKRTALWTNTAWRPARPLCRQDCSSCTTEGKHIAHAQQGAKGGTPGRSLEHLHALPAQLVREIAEFVHLL